jgi:hypothetical protein
MGLPQFGQIGQFGAFNDKTHCAGGVRNDPIANSGV